MKFGLGAKIGVGLFSLVVLWLVMLFSPPKVPPPEWVAHYHTAEKASGNFEEWDRQAKLALEDAKNYGGKMPPAEPMSQEQRITERLLFWIPFMQDRGETTTYVEAMNNLAMHYKNQKRWADAERFYRTILDLQIAADSDPRSSYGGPSYSKLIEVLKASGKTKEAIELQKLEIAKAEERAAKFPTSPDYQENVLRVKAHALETEGKFDEAEACWKQLVDLRKGELTKENLARLKIEKSKSMEYFEVGLFTPSKLDELAEFYQRRKDYIKEEETLAKKQALRESIYPKYSPSLGYDWERLASLYEKHEQYDQAEKALVESIHCLEKYDTWKDLARIYEKHHKYDLASDAMLKSVKLLESDKERQKQRDFNNEVAESYVDYAGLLEKAGKKAEAKVASEKALQLDPSVNHPSPHVYVR